MRHPLSDHYRSGDTSLTVTTEYLALVIAFVVERVLGQGGRSVHPILLPTPSLSG
jgi:hypothetical protein